MNELILVKNYDKNKLLNVANELDISLVDLDILINTAIKIENIQKSVARNEFIKEPIIKNSYITYTIELSDELNDLLKTRLPNKYYEKLINKLKESYSFKDIKNIFEEYELEKQSQFINEVKTSKINYEKEHIQIFKDALKLYNELSYELYKIDDISYSYFDSFMKDFLSFFRIIATLQTTINIETLEKDNDYKKFCSNLKDKYNIDIETFKAIITTSLFENPYSDKLLEYADKYNIKNNELYDLLVSLLYLGFSSDMKKLKDYLNEDELYRITMDIEKDKERCITVSKKYLDYDINDNSVICMSICCYIIIHKIKIFIGDSLKAHQKDTSNNNASKDDSKDIDLKASKDTLFDKTNDVALLNDIIYAITDNTYLLTLIESDSNSKEYIIDDVDKNKIEHLKIAIKNNYSELTSDINPVKHLKKNSLLNKIYDLLNEYKNNLINKIETECDKIFDKYFEVKNARLVCTSEHIKNKTKKLYHNSQIENVYDIDDDVIEKYVNECISNNPTIKYAIINLKDISLKGLSKDNEKDKLAKRIYIIIYNYYSNLIDDKDGINELNRKLKEKETVDNIDRLIISSFNGTFIFSLIMNYTCVKLLNINANLSKFINYLVELTSQRLNNNDGLCCLLSRRYIKNVIERNKFQNLLETDLDIKDDIDFESLYNEHIKIKNNKELVIEYKKLIENILNVDDKPIRLEFTNGATILDFSKSCYDMSIKYTNYEDTDLSNTIIYNKPSISFMYKDNKSYIKKFLLYSIIDNNNTFLKENSYIYTSEQEYNNSCNSLNKLRFGIDSYISYSQDIVNKFNEVLKAEGIIEYDVNRSDFNGFIIYDDIMYIIDEFKFVVDFLCSNEELNKNDIISVIYDIICCYVYTYKNFNYASLFVIHISNTIFSILDITINDLKIVLNSDLKYGNQKVIDFVTSNEKMKDELHIKIYDILRYDIKKLYLKSTEHDTFNKFSYITYKKYIHYDETDNTLLFDYDIIKHIKEYRIFDLYVLNDNVFDNNVFDNNVFDNNVFDNNVFERTHMPYHDKSIMLLIKYIVFNYIFEIKLKKYLKNDTDRLFITYNRTSIVSEINSTLNHGMAITYEYDDDKIKARVLDPNYFEFNIYNDFICSYVNHEFNSNKYDDNQLEDMKLHAIKHMNAGSIDKNKLKKILIVLVLFLGICFIIAIICIIVLKPTKVTSQKILIKSNISKDIN